MPAVGDHCIPATATLTAAECPFVSSMLIYMSSQRASRPEHPLRKHALRMRSHYMAYVLPESPVHHLLAEDSMAKSSRNNLQVAKRGKKFSKKLQPEEMVVLDERKKCMVVYQNGRQVVSRERESLAEAKGEFYYTKVNTMPLCLARPATGISQ